MLLRHFTTVSVAACAMFASFAASATEPESQLQQIQVAQLSVQEEPGQFWRDMFVPLPPVRPANLEALQSPRPAPAKKVQAVRAVPPVVYVAMPSRPATLRPFWMTVGTGF